MGFILPAPAAPITSAPPSGPAGGSLTGTYPNPTLGSQVVANTNLAANAVTDAKLASNAVTTAKILDSNVTSAKLADGAVTSAKLATLTWNNVSFLNSWSNMGGAYQTVQYCKDLLGFVHLRGCALYGSAAVAFTLPSTHQPGALEIFPPNPSRDGSDYGIQITDSGVVSAQYPLPATGLLVSFSGITFYAA